MAERLIDITVVLNNGDSFKTKVSAEHNIGSSSFTDKSLWQFPVGEGKVMLTGDKINRFEIPDRV